MSGEKIYLGQEWFLTPFLGHTFRPGHDRSDQAQDTRSRTGGEQPQRVP